MGSSRTAGATTRPALVIGALLLVLVTTAVPALTGFRLPLVSMDEAELLLYPNQIAHGRTPNLDFYTVYGTPSYWFLLAIYKVFGFTVTVERSVALGYHLLIVAGVYISALRRSVVGAVLAALTAVTLLLPLAFVAFAWLGALALLLFGLLCAAHPSSRLLWVLGGVLLGASTGWRYEFSVVALVGLLPLVIRHQRWRWAVPGFLLGFVPVLVHLTVAWRLTYENVVIGRIGGNFRQSPALIPLYVYTGLLACAVGAAVLLMRAIGTRDRLQWSWALTVIAMLPQAVQRLDPPHVSYVAVVALPLATFATHRRQNRFSPGTRTAAAGVALTVSLPAFVVNDYSVLYLPGRETVELREGARTVDYPPALAADAARILALLHERVPRGSNVFIGTTDMGRPNLNAMPLYVLLSDRYRFDSYFLELAPGVAERDGSGLADDIRRADALILTESDASGMRLQFPSLPSGFTEANQAVAEKFCAVATAGVFSLYLPC